MKSWKRWAVSAVIFSGFFFMLGFFSRYHLPQLKRWLLFEIEQQSTAKSPFKVVAKNVDLSLFRPDT